MDKFKRQIPNIITWSRLGLLIPTLACFFTGNVIPAAAIFSGAALTDGVDGYVARKYGWTSKFGAKLDAFCDKVYVAIGSVMPLIASGGVYAIPLALEGTISAYNLYRHYVKHQNVQSTKTGKLKTCLLFPTLILGMCAPKLGISKDIVNAMVLATGAMQTATLASYFVDSNKQDLEKINNNPTNNSSDCELEKEEVSEKQYSDTRFIDAATSVCEDLKKPKEEYEPVGFKENYFGNDEERRLDSLEEKGRARRRRFE